MMIHCSGPCEQGRKPCPTPEACEREEGKARIYWEDIAISLMAVIVIGLFVLGWL